MGGRPLTWIGRRAPGAGADRGAWYAPPAMTRDEIPTPALLLDLDRFERNVEKMAAFVKAAGKKLRPHAKTHKCPESRGARSPPAPSASAWPRSARPT